MTQQRGTILGSVRAAFSSWWALFGILAASITGFNLLRKVIDIGLAKILADLLAIYQRWVHLPVQWLFDWLRWSPPPAWAIDLALLWLLIGGVVLRSAWGVRVEALDTWARDNDNKFWQWLLETRAALPAFLFLTTFAWPVVVLFMLQKPHITRFLGKGINPLSHHRDDKRFRYYCDMRIVLAVQALTAAACVSVWVVTNILLNMYP